MQSEKINTAALKKDIEDFVKGNSASLKKEIEDFVKGLVNSKPVTHVGQIILSTTLNTSDKVKNIYGGTWEAFGAGKVLVGAGSNGGRNFTAGSTGGEYAHTLTINEMPDHNHSSIMHNTNGAGINYLNVKKEDPGMGLTTGNTTTTSAGGGGSHNNMQPYVVVYMWRRVS